MGLKGQFVRWVSVLGLAGLVACSGLTSADIATDIVGEATPMNLESTAFAAGSEIPSRYTCDGDNRSPALAWEAPPEGTGSLALVVEDPDAPGGTFVHWLVYNLPPETRSLPEGVTPDSRLANGALQGKNDFGKVGYGGPCPPRGTHRYFFKLYALGSPLNLPPAAPKGEVLKAMQGKVLGQADLMGRYTRQR